MSQQTQLHGTLVAASRPAEVVRMQPMSTRLSNQVRNGVKAALECYSTCQETITHCLDRGGKYADDDLVKLLMNCAEICHAHGQFLLSRSSYMTLTGTVCAEVCEATARACEQVADDLQAKICAEVCRRCAELARSVADSAYAA